MPMYMYFEYSTTHAFTHSSIHAYNTIHTYIEYNTIQNIHMYIHV